MVDFRPNPDIYAASEASEASETKKQGIVTTYYAFSTSEVRAILSKASKKMIEQDGNMSEDDYTLQTKRVVNAVLELTLRGVLS